MDPRRGLALCMVVLGAYAFAAAPASAGDDDTPAKKPGRTAVDGALDWLARHQSENGRWSSAGFAERCTSKEACDGGGEAVHDLGVTSLALLAFLGAGETHSKGEHRKSVKNGLRALVSAQASDGGFTPRTSPRFLHDQAVGTHAICEAYGVTGSRLFKERAQNSVNFLMAARNPKLAWRYGVRGGENDTVVTAAVAQALFAASLANLEVDDDALAGALAWMDQVTDPKTGEVGYRKRGDGTTRYENRFPAGSEGLTAAGALVRIYTRRADRDAAITDEALWKGVEFVSDHPPRWEEKGGPVDLYAWLHGAQVAHQAGATRFDPWFAALRKAVEPRQTSDESCARGSWAPTGAWGKEGGRVYATATLCIALETPYRYKRIHEFPPRPTRTDK